MFIDAGPVQSANSPRRLPFLFGGLGQLCGGEPPEGCRVISGPFPAGISNDDPLNYAYDERIEPRYMMPLSLSYDHRLVDGAAAARFLNEVIENLQSPGKLLLGS